MNKHQTLMNVTALLLALLTAMPLSAKAEEPLAVVATFSILGDMVERIGGSEITVSTLVGRNGDTHVYQPTPADAKAVKEASILFTNGLEYEGWLERLAEAAEFSGLTVVSTDGIELIAAEHHDDDEHVSDRRDEDHDDEKHKGGEDDHDDKGDHDDGESHEGKKHEEGHHAHYHGEFDPHGWLSLQNAIVYVDNITAALAKIAPAKASIFYQNRADYVNEIETLDQQIKTMIETLPANARTIVTSHDAFQYFGRAYGLKFLAPQGLSTESEASARDVAHLIEQIRAEGIAAVFVENVADSRLLQQIASETGSTIGGRLYPGALSDTDGPAATYLDLMLHNATTIANALK